MSVEPAIKVRAHLRIPLLIGVCVLLTGLFALALLVRARSEVNQVALAKQAKGVSTIPALAARYRPTRHYVGTIAPWLEARIGPQFAAAYVDTVLVRPGDRVSKGQVLATLDCKSASAQSKVLQQQARALSTTQEALAKEAGRLSGLLAGGFVSPNEVDRRSADSASKEAELFAANARLIRAALEVDDCVLRAPFEGEVSDRATDPGGFARPGAAILTVLDREKVRVLLDVPEIDFAVVVVGTPVQMRLSALGSTHSGLISRRAPSADAGTRTIHAEIDLIDSERRIPVGTTAELTIEVGEPQPAVELPLRAAAIRGDSASVFVVIDGVSHKQQVAVLGEAQGRVFLSPTLVAGTHVVTEGRSLLKDGDRVIDKLESASQKEGRP